MQKPTFTEYIKSGTFAQDIRKAVIAVDGKKFLKCREASEILCVSAATVRNAVRRGDLPGIQLGSHVLVSREGLERLVAQAVETRSEAASVV